MQTREELSATVTDLLQEREEEHGQLMATKSLADEQWEEIDSLVLEGFVPFQVPRRKRRKLARSAACRCENLQLVVHGSPP